MNPSIINHPLDSSQGPIPLSGRDFSGFALEPHTIGYTTPSGFASRRRSALGESMYRYRYQGDDTLLPAITQPFTEAIPRLFPNSRFDAIFMVPILPSRSDYPRCSAFIAELAKQSGILCAQFAIKRVDASATASDSSSPLFSPASPGTTGFFSGKTVLVIDDIYRSGKTLHGCCGFLAQPGKAAQVRALVGTIVQPR